MQWRAPVRYVADPIRPSARDVRHGKSYANNTLMQTLLRAYLLQVADFGLSRLLTATTGDSCGGQQYVPTSEWATVAYMAGEYLDNKLCKSSDVSF